MKKGITKLIAENIPPANAAALAVFDGDTKICDIDITKMQRSNLGEKLYSFGLVSDMHINITDGYVNSTRFDNALSFFESQGASFCAHAGDITSIGFWYPISETDGTSYYYPHQFELFRSICQKHSIPVFGCCGNHESYNGYNITGTYTDTYGADTTLVVNNLEKLQEYTGDGLLFTKTYGNDVFICVGQSFGAHPMTDESLQWLYERLEENRNKRCFVFIHPYVSSVSSGNPLGLHALPLFDYWGETKTKVFISLMTHYANAMLFHGHSHIRPEMQLIVENVNYSKVLGFRDFSLPSSSNSRTVKDGKLVTDGSAFGYIAEVYESCVVMKGYDIVENKYVPIAQYCIDTTLKTIEANTFIDNTGTITT